MPRPSHAHKCGKVMKCLIRRSPFRKPHVGSSNAGHLVRPRVSHGRQTRSSRARSRSRSRSPHPTPEAREDPAAAPRSRRRRGRSSSRRGRGRRRSRHRRPGGGSGNWRGGRRAVHHGCPSWPRFIREDQSQYEALESIMPVHAARHVAAVPDDGPRCQRVCRGRRDDCQLGLPKPRCCEPWC